LKNLLILCLLCCNSLGLAQTKETKTEEITLANKDIRIAATVIYPHSKEKLPAVVLVHGSGTSARDNPWTAAYADALSKRGIIVLHPDKRGSGRSGGDWRTASLVDLAGDVIAAVDYLSTRSEVDASRIGVIGFSQGADVIPIAAAKSDKIKMVIDVSGSVIPLKEQITDEIVKLGEREGQNADQIETLKTINERSYQFANDRSKWEDYITPLRAALTTELGAYDSIKGFPQDRELWVWDWLKLVGDTDPMNYWKQLDVPLLFIFGGKDTQIDIRKSTGLIQDNLDPLEKNYSILYFRLNGHALFREDCNDLIAEWLRDKGEH